MYESCVTGYFEVLLFPVLLSARLIRLFDADIQAVFGLITLYARLHGNSRDNLVIGLCQLFFARYLKARCVLEIEYDVSRIRDT